MPSGLSLNEHKIEYIITTRVFGITKDGELNFKQYALQKLKKRKKSGGLLSKLPIKTWKTMILTALFYSALDHVAPQMHQNVKWILEQNYYEDL